MSEPSEQAMLAAEIIADKWNDLEGMEKRAATTKIAKLIDAHFKDTLDPIREQKIKRMIEIGAALISDGNHHHEELDEWNTLKSELYGETKPK